MIKSYNKDGMYIAEYTPESINNQKAAIFVPGMGEELNYRNADGVARALAHEGILTYSFDMSGHGESEQVPFSDQSLHR